ncbi:WD40-repeat-containing domain protein, partial [Blyttiomyces helicus]
KRLCIYDVLSIKPRLIASISQLEYNPLCLAHAGTENHPSQEELILWGDDGGWVNVLTIDTRKVSDSEADEQLTPAKLSKRDSYRKNNMSFYRKKTHNEWVLKIEYYPEMNAFVSCASEATRSLVIGDLERKTVRYVTVPKGINCFDFCRRPSFLVTGGRDKIIRLWNPYVLSKPAGNLYGHNAVVVDIIVIQAEGNIISLSEDKVIKVWSARNLNCLQTLTDKVPHRPENIISAIYFDATNNKLITGSSKLEIWPLYRNLKRSVARSHDAGLVSAMFNESFHQVVSGCQNGTVSIWDLASGGRIFQFHEAHGKLEITAMCFDRTGRRLITGSRDNVIKMWNFNNGQILRKMLKGTEVETTDGSGRYVVAVGWDRKITIFIDDSSHFEATPVRVLNGAGSGAHRGHEDDISAVAFCPPSMLATSSVDGVIVIWNLESGYIKATMREPFLDLRSKEEKAIEKLNCQSSDDEGMSTMATNADATMLLLGGSKGHVRVRRSAAFPHNISPRPGRVINRLWAKSHQNRYSSVNYVNTYDLILTAAKDLTIRVWTPEGEYIGIFGQDEPWVIHDRLTYRPLPEDVRLETELELQRTLAITKRREKLTKTVIDTWRGGLGLSQLMRPSPEPLDEAPPVIEGVKMVRDRAIQASVMNIWREYCSRRKLADNWTIESDLVTLVNTTRHFSFDNPRHPRSTKTCARVKHDAVYRALNCHALEDIPLLPIPGPKSRLVGKQGGEKSGEQMLRSNATVCWRVGTGS